MTPSDLEVAHSELRERLFAAGHLIPTGVDGLYGKSEEYETVLQGVQAACSRLARPDAPRFASFPPMLPRTIFDKIQYLRNFPQLSGPVYSFRGDDAAHGELIRRLDAGERYEDLLTQTDVALTPACCYPLYPSLPHDLPDDGVIIEHQTYCFRHEPSVDPMRLQAFRMWENVRVADPDRVLAWREVWLGRLVELFDQLQLEARADVANDAFFGRVGRLMAMGQRANQLKIEFLVPVFGEDDPTACASVNYHRNHFGELYHLHMPDGSEAHSSCAGVGLDRCAVALFQRHGMSSAAWPSPVRAALWG